MLNDLANKAHQNAVDKGFYDLPKSIILKMQNSTFTQEEIQAVRDALIAQRLMLIVSELGEALEANRKKRNPPNIEGFNLDRSHGVDFKKAFENNYIKDSFQDELADSVIRIGDLAGYLGIDLDVHVDLKTHYNSLREKMHGKAY
jgi:NTP pyrophosphatase (non-canonical NTP hydrolase)